MQAPEGGAGLRHKEPGPPLFLNFAVCACWPFAGKLLTEPGLCGRCACADVRRGVLMVQEGSLVFVQDVVAIIATMENHSAHYGCVRGRKVWTSAAYVEPSVSVCRGRAWKGWTCTCTGERTLQAHDTQGEISKGCHALANLTTESLENQLAVADEGRLRRNGRPRSR